MLDAQTLTPVQFTSLLAAILLAGPQGPGYSTTTEAVLVAEQIQADVAARADVRRRNAALHIGEEL